MMVYWIVGGVAVWLLVELLLWLLGGGGLLLYLATAIYHAVKLDPPPGVNDSNWTRDQGKDVDS